MITLFTSKGELSYKVILFTFLVLYALGRFMMSRFNQISAKVQKMTNKELIDNFTTLCKDYKVKPAFWKAQELREILEERQKRGLFKKMSFEELTASMEHLSQICRTLPKRSRFGYEQELIYVQKERQRRHLF